MNTYIPDELVHLFPLLEVHLNQAVEGSVADGVVPVSNLLGHLLEGYRG